MRNAECPIGKWGSKYQLLPWPQQLHQELWSGLLILFQLLRRLLPGITLKKAKKWAYLLIIPGITKWWLYLHAEEVDSQGLPQFWWTLRSSWKPLSPWLRTMPPATQCPPCHCLRVRRCTSHSQASHRDPHMLSIFLQDFFRRHRSSYFSSYLEGLGHKISKYESLGDQSKREDKKELRDKHPALLSDCQFQNEVQPWCQLNSCVFLQIQLKGNLPVCVCLCYAQILQSPENHQASEVDASGKGRFIQTNLASQPSRTGEH